MDGLEVYPFSVGVQHTVVMCVLVYILSPFLVVIFCGSMRSDADKTSSFIHSYFRLHFTPFVFLYIL